MPIALVLAFVVGSAVGLALCWAIATQLLARGFPLPDPARRIGNLDGLRGFLALSVLVSHAVLWVRVTAFAVPWGVGSDQMRALGQVPVAVFFMITGLLFYPVARAGFDVTGWRGFAVARIVRIMPMVLASLMLILPGLWWRSGFTTDPLALAATARNLVRWLVFVDQPELFGVVRSDLANAGVFWTLTVEWLFYLAFLPTLALLRTLTRPRLPGWTTPALNGVIWAVLMLAWREQADTMIPFTLGMMIREASEHARIAAWLRRPDVAAGALLLAAAAVAWLPPPVSDRTAVFFAPALACITCGQRIRGLLSSPSARVLGELSFGIYVLHGLVLWWDVQLFGGILAVHPARAVLVMLPAAAVLTVLLAAAAHLLVERPAMAWGRRATRPRRDPTPIPHPAA